MPGVRSLMRQAQRIQKKMEELQTELAEKEIAVTSGGGAVVVTVTAMQEVRSIKIDPELLQEEADLVEEVVLEGVREALAKAKEIHSEEMEKVSGGMPMGGMF